MFGKYLLLGLAPKTLVAFAQSADRVDLGRLPTSATVSFVRGAGSEWGLKTAGGWPR